MRTLLKPEPISIPTPARPKIDIPLAAATSPLDAACSGLVHLLKPAGAPSQPADAVSAKDAARQRDLERLNEVLSHSEIQPEQLQLLEVLGAGSSGVVQKVLHVPSDSVLALKVIPVNADEAARKAILLELKTLHDSVHPAIVSFYGAYFREGAVHIALEYMDASLLDLMRATRAPLPERVLVSMVLPVLQGLCYLHRQRHTVHRDIKPSNILVDSAANVKIADFGVSGELSCTLSKAASWVGTMHYMSPERIAASPYSYDSDMWSLGITVLELATGAFPYATTRTQRLGFWELLDLIVEGPPPSAPAHFSPEFHSFVNACLQKAPDDRASSTQLLQHPLLAIASDAAPLLAAWLGGALAAMPPRGQSVRPADGADPSTAQSGLGEKTLPRWRHDEAMDDDDHDADEWHNPKTTPAARHVADDGDAMEDDA